MSLPNHSTLQFQNPRENKNVLSKNSLVIFLKSGQLTGEEGRSEMKISRSAVRILINRFQDR